MKRYLWNILVSLDQFGNTLALGDPDETISSRIGKQKREGRLNWFTRPLSRFLNWLDPNHSLDAIEEDEGKDSLT